MADASADLDGYQPGVCNIGGPERKRRRRAGHLGVAAGLALLLAVALLDLPPYFGLASTPFFIGGAIGYIQDRLRFCAHYGRAGEYNLGSLDESPEPVTDETARRTDRRRSRQIFLYSLVSGLAAAIGGTLFLYVLV